MICENVFLPTHQNFAFEFPGLLSSKHSHKSLKHSLEACGNPSRAKDNIRIRASDKVKKEIVEYLKEIVDIANKLSNE